MIVGEGWATDGVHSYNALANKIQLAPLMSLVLYPFSENAVQYAKESKLISQGSLWARIFVTDHFLRRFYAQQTRYRLAIRPSDGAVDIKDSTMMRSRHWQDYRTLYPSLPGGACA